MPETDLSTTCRRWAFVGNRLPKHDFESLLILAGLATQTMLKSARRQLADGQEPVAYYWSGHADVMLYQAAEAVDMPALTPGRQRRWDEARTCTRCGARSVDPMARGRDDKRYCYPCQEPAGKALWEAERTADRHVLTMWAADVVQARTVVLAAAESHSYWRRVRLEDVAGVVLLDERVRYSSRPLADLVESVDFTGTLSPADLAYEINALSSHRVIAWSDWTAPNIDLPTGGESDTVRVLTVNPDDRLSPRWDRWIGKCEGEQYRSMHPRLAVQKFPRDVIEQLVVMREALLEMAADPRPTPDEACAVHDDAHLGRTCPEGTP